MTPPANTVTPPPIKPQPPPPTADPVWLAGFNRAMTTARASLSQSRYAEARSGQAAARGGPVRSLPGRHLDLATRPAEGAAAIPALVGRTRS